MTSASLLSEPVWRAIDANGEAISGAQAFFYLTGTTTPSAVYSGTTLATPLANPVVADSGGLFAPMYPDPSLGYRMILKDASGSTIQDIDPVFLPTVSAAGSITSSMLAPGAAAGNLGYTALNKGGDIATGLRAAFGPTIFADNVGYLGVPPSIINAIYTFAIGDAGKRLRHTDATSYAWTIPPNSVVPFPIGTVLPGRNFGTGVITLTRGAGVSMRLAGSATDANLSAAQWAYWALEKEDTDVWIASGTGLS